jgi:hypothetical protein
MFFCEDGHAVINRHHQTNLVAPRPLVAFSSAAGKRRRSQSRGLFCPTAIYFGPIGPQVRRRLSGRECSRDVQVVHGLLGSHEVSRGQRIPLRLPMPEKGNRVMRSRPSFAKDRRLRLIDLPVEKIKVAGPCVHLDPANFAAEAAGMLGWMLLPSRGVGQSAVGTAKIFGFPYVACHCAIMRRSERVFQPIRLP